MDLFGPDSRTRAASFIQTWGFLIFGMIKEEGCSGGV